MTNFEMLSLITTFTYMGCLKVYDLQISLYETLLDLLQCL